MKEKAPMISVPGRCKGSTHSCTKSVGGKRPDSMKTTKPKKKVKVDPSCLEIQVTKASSENLKLLEGQSQQCCQKIKLQLFPMDETTKNELEQDNHNPYLELTLATRKKISSVVKHLNIKWGSSKSASGELMLFPYKTGLNNLFNSQRWTLKDSNVSAADVHASLGSPINFRLRYGWYPNLEQNLSCMPASNTFGDDREPEKNITSNIIGDNKMQLPAPGNEKVPTFNDNSNVVGKPVGNKDDSAAEGAKVLWVDGISNISFGALISELSQTSNAGVGHLLPAQKNSMILQSPNTCDSFDAAIAAFIIAQQGSVNRSMQPSPCSIWEAEETCHPFAKTSLPSRETELRDASLNQNVENNSINHLERPIAACPQQEQTPNLETGRQFTIEPDLQTRSDCAEIITNFQKQGQDGRREEPEAALAFQAEPSDCYSIVLGGVEISSTLEGHLAPCSRERSGVADALGLSGLIASSMDSFQNFSIF